MKACVLFDFDGTIMDTEPAIMASYGYLFEKYRTIDAFTEERRIKVLGPALEVMMAEFFPEPWKQERQGQRIGQKVYLEYGEKFDCPVSSGACKSGQSNFSPYSR